MEKLQVFIVDSFAEQPFKGNPCGIVLYADELRELHMKQIAQELNLAETAFVYHKKNGTYKVRYFTPTQEIDFCGHATLAVAWIMADNNILLETNVGLISFEFEYVLNQIDKIYMKQIEPKIKDFTGSLVELFEIFNIKSQDLDSRFPVKLVYTGNWDIVLPISDKEVLQKIYPDIIKLKKHNDFYQVSSTHLFYFQNQEIITRNFGPSVGIDEDLVTGSTNGALVGYLMLEGFLPWKENKFFIKQINSLNREGILYVKTRIVNNKPEIFIGGKAIKILEGNIEITI